MFVYVPSLAGHQKRCSFLDGSLELLFGLYMSRVHTFALLLAAILGLNVLPLSVPYLDLHLNARF